MPKYAVKWNNDNTYLEYSRFWDWTKSIDKASTFSSHEEAKALIQREAPHFHSPHHYECPYSIVEVPEKKESNSSKFVIRWRKDNTYITGTKVVNADWTKDVRNARSFNSKKEAEDWMIIPRTGKPYWDGCGDVISIDEVHILNFRY